MTSIITHDGTCLIVDPDVGTVSGATRDEAMREVLRRKEAKKSERAA